MGIFEIFYEPGKVFASLPQRRRAWIAPMLLGLVLIVCTAVVAIQRIGMATITRQFLENSGFNLSADQMQQAIDRANTPQQIYITSAQAAAGSVLALLVIAGALMIFAMMANQQPRFGTMFSMVSLAFLPYRLIICVMTVLVLLISKDPAALDSTNLLSTNAGAFMNRTEMARPIYTLFTNLDVLSFFEIGLLAYGFSKITRSSFFYGVIAVGSLWAIYVVTRMGMSVLF
jgi:hypothetical protein